MRRLGSSLAMKATEGSGKQESLKNVYGLNQDIGRMAREFPDLAQTLREMQLEVNLVTVNLKRDEWESALAALRRATTALGAVEAAAARTRSRSRRDL